MNIMPITELRDTNKISKICKETREPVYLTKNGYDELVVMDSKTFNDFEYRMYMHDEIIKGIHDIKSGNVMDFDKAMKEVSDKYGL